MERLPQLAEQHKRAFGVTAVMARLIYDREVSSRATRLHPVWHTSQSLALTTVAQESFINCECHECQSFINCERSAAPTAAVGSSPGVLMCAWHSCSGGDADSRVLWDTA